MTGDEPSKNSSCPASPDLAKLIHEESPHPEFEFREETSSSFTDNRVTEDDLVHYLTHSLDPLRTQTVQLQIQNDQDLRQSVIALQSTWDLLDLAAVSEPTTDPADQARKILLQEIKRKRFKELLLRSCALLVSAFSFIAAWTTGVAWVKPSQSAMLEHSSKLPLAEFLIVAGDPVFLDKLLNDSRSSVFETFRPFHENDFSSTLIVFQQEPRSAIQWSRLQSQYSDFRELSTKEQSAILEMAGMVENLTAEEKLILFSRLVGLKSWFDSLSGNDREQFLKAKMPNRWNRAVAGAEQVRRFQDTSKKKNFSISELNRPDFILDLATVSALWLKMTPQERLAIERRSRSIRSDPIRRNERFRTIAQAIESARPGTFPLLEQLKGGTRTKGALRNDLNKQAREKRNQEYLDLLRNHPPPTDSSEIGKFAEQLPPWLIEILDPLPPEEARRILGILKVLVDQQLRS
ncbi:MAG: hypothetical protein RJA81_944 [Planctomycetota bacterium]|jgi:hypothetical protein